MRPAARIGVQGRKFDGFWTAGFERERLILFSEGAPLSVSEFYRRRGERDLIEAAPCSISTLHKLWVRLEDEHHQLEIKMRQPGVGKAALARLRDRQAWLLLEISVVVAEIRDAPATTLEDYAALLDVAIEHEVDLAGDIACYGPADFPMIVRLVRALAEKVPGFEFNSLRRWLSSPGQYEQVLGKAAGDGAGLRDSVGFGRA
jgi:hypothetical protein